MMIFFFDPFEIIACSLKKKWNKHKFYKVRITWVCGLIEDREIIKFDCFIDKLKFREVRSILFKATRQFVEESQYFFK